MAQQTALEWFIKETTKRFKVLPKDTNKGFFANIEDYKNMVEQAKQMEKEQIIKAFNDLNDDTSAEQYYNEIYNK